MEEPQITPSESIASRSAAALRELQARAQAVASNRQERLSQLEAEITRQLDAIAETLAAQRAVESETAADVGATQAEIASVREQLDQQGRELEKRAEHFAEFDRQLKSREAAVEQRSAEFVQREEELTARQQELDLRQHGLDRDEQAAKTAAAERAALDRERNELAEQVTKLKQQGQSSEQQGAEWKSRIDELTRKLAEQQAAADSLRSNADAARSVVEMERDELKKSLSATRETLQASQQQATAASVERDELKQKFALALDDVQRFRTRVAELEQDLARRPAAGQADSTELVALRAERDALAERLTAMENVPPAPADGADAQHLADLQRRFELAVEDVRELKTKNAQIESRLAATRKDSAASSDAGEMDWESQKRRMLAALEGDADEGDPEQQRERASIADTIQITDAVVAEKDQEIKRLQAQLAAGAEKSTADDGQREAAVNQLLDDDEIIRQHRQKTAQLEHDMDAKMRAGELELSVERAKMARQKVELEQLRIELESNRESGGGGG
ncbi:MAG: hypothetical protein WD669_06115, partial [Pirellulales bacterium]